jgi:hypothetical protein
MVEADPVLEKIQFRNSLRAISALLVQLGVRCSYGNCRQDD